MNDKIYITEKEMGRYEAIVRNYEEGKSELTPKVDNYLGLMLQDIVIRSSLDVLPKRINLVNRICELHGIITYGKKVVDDPKDGGFEVKC